MANQMRIVKHTSKIDDCVYYIIEENTMFSGWVMLRPKWSTTPKNTFDTLKEAQAYFNLYNGGSLTDVEIIT